MTLPEPLRQQLGRLREQGCPAALIERAMGMNVSSGGEWNVTYRQNGLHLSRHASPDHIFVVLCDDGAVKLQVFIQTNYGEMMETITIPPPRGEA